MLNKLINRNEHVASEIIPYVSTYGWDNGIQLCNDDKPETAAELKEIIHPRNTAWKLYASIGQTCIIVDATFGTMAIAIRKYYEKIIVLSQNYNYLKCLKKRFVAGNISNIDLLCISDYERIPLADNSVDSIILQGIEQIRTAPNKDSKQTDSKSRSNIFIGFERALKREGTLLFSMRNRYSLKKNGKNKTSIRAVYGLMDVRRKLKDSGFMTVNAHVIEYSNNKISDVWKIGDHNLSVGFEYRGVKNKVKKVIKKILYDKYFCEEYLISAAKENSEIKIILDDIVREIKNEIGYEGSVTLKRYFIPSTGTKIIALMALENGKEIIVRSFLMDRYDTVQRHVKALKMINSKSLSIAAPKVLMLKSSGGFPYAVEEKVRGVSIVGPIRRIDNVFEQAAEVLMEFNLKTKKRITLSDENIKKYIDSRVNGFKEIFKFEEKSKIDSALDSVRAVLSGKTFFSMWEHGDYKIENIIISTKTYDVSGVIDWDYFNENGLPFFDLYRLISSYYQTKFDITSDNAFEKYIFKLNFGGIVDNVFKKYMKITGIDKKCAGALSTLYWMSLKNRAFNKKNITEEKRKKLVKVLDTIGNSLQP